jgi:hypothetical protein
MDEPYSYIGRRACGCIRAARVIVGNPKEIAKDVADMVASGLILERVPSQYVRENWGECPHEDKQLELM